MFSIVRRLSPAASACRLSVAAAGPKFPAFRIGAARAFASIPKPEIVPNTVEHHRYVSRVPGWNEVRAAVAQRKKRKQKEREEGCEPKAAKSARLTCRARQDHFVTRDCPTVWRAGNDAPDELQRLGFSSHVRVQTPSFFWLFLFFLSPFVLFFFCLLIFRLRAAADERTSARGAARGALSPEWLLLGAKRVFAHGGGCAAQRGAGAARGQIWRLGRSASGARTEWRRRSLW